MKKASPSPLYRKVREILESARASVVRSVNSAQVAANWLIGREIVEEEQKGTKRAEYGARLIAELSSRLRKDFGNGYSVNNLEHFRRFYLTYPDFFGPRIPHAVRGESHKSLGDKGQKKSHAPRKQSGAAIEQAPPFALSLLPELSRAPRDPSWLPGRHHPNLSWTHYRTLLRVEGPEARAFYEIEALKNNWSARELERQINSLLYERLAKSRDKKGLLRLATKGHEVQRPSDVFKDPVVIEFLGLPESPRLVETDLEEALIGNLQAFLLELGKGFAFVARQERITLDGDHFYIDLVFYHTVLKCFILIDLKIGKLTHEDLGQLQLYVNYFDEERRTPGDAPTLGLILCTDKNDAVVRYTLGPDQAAKIFASRYKLHLPSEAELKAELRREWAALRRETHGA
ncbi:MAG: DUF1016 domain-containing protein [Planctomycetes bacterium]|nr:DUF1016 domain-containing protein [Planctomycetota bacterium]